MFHFYIRSHTQPKCEMGDTHTYSSHVGQDSSQDTEISNTQSPKTHHIHEITAIANTKPTVGYKLNVTYTCVHICIYIDPYVALQ